MKTEILGVLIDKVTPEEALKRALGYIESNGRHDLFTPGPEFVMTARKDSEFMEILNHASMAVPDGIGIVYASKFNKVKLKERVAGYDLVQSIFKEISKTGKTVYFFGGAKGVAEQARVKMTEKYKGLRVVGVRDGYFDENEERNIINDIMKKKPDILLVGIGSPKQEKWISKNKDRLPAKLYIGVGGSLDGMAGIVPRAPKLFIKLGLEWFYRLLKQPSRFKRQLQLPLFMITVIKEKIYGGTKGKK